MCGVCVCVCLLSWKKEEKMRVFIKNRKKIQKERHQDNKCIAHTKYKVSTTLNNNTIHADTNTTTHADDSVCV